MRLIWLHFGIILTLLLGSVESASAQNWGTLAGRVVDASEDPIPGATILINGTNFGTAANEDGSYRLRLPASRFAIRVSAVGFATYIDSVTVVRDEVTTRDITLEEEALEMEGITVEDENRNFDAGVYELDPEAIQNIPTPLKDGFRALKVVPGVVTNNELSSQYSVRGGGFNENLIFLNGFEIYMPFRPRQGEQEGLGLFNPDLAERVTFYTGGFPARYGGKLSSALDVRYRKPMDERLNGSVSLSLLDASASAAGSSKNNKIGWVAGFRKARARYLFASQELKGNYQPDYTDFQGALTYRIADGHELEVIGIVADHSFRLDPSNRRTFFGTVSQDPRVPSNLQSLWLDFSGEEVDGYATRFGGVRLSNRLSEELRWSNDFSFFRTEEDENFDISGSAVLYLVDPGGNPNNNEEFITTGVSRTEDRASNQIEVDTWTGQSNLQWFKGRHVAELGGYVRGLFFADALEEKSVVTGRDQDGELVRLVVDSLKGTAQLDELQAGFYVQDAVDLLPQRDRLMLTGGLRADYYSFNSEWTLSPRLTVRYLANDRTTLTGSWGIYYQAPTYRELRGQPDPSRPLEDNLNRNIKSQRSMQFVAGLEQFLPQSRFVFRAEAYYKSLTNIISYDIENVRVQYSGENDAEGYAYGLDLQLRGEFVPGLESWANYSFLNSQEQFLPAFQDDFKQGSNPRPTDQRHTLSLYIADYIPDDESWKLHLRTLFGSGLPYTPPIEGEKIGNIITQVPGDRFSARYQRFFRFDMGITKNVVITDKGLNGPLSLQLTGEILNVFNMINTVAYSWIPRSDGIWTRVPTRLTPRTLNVRMSITF